MKKKHLSSAKTKNSGVRRLVKPELRTTGHWTPMRIRLINEFIFEIRKVLGN